MSKRRFACSTGSSTVLPARRSRDQRRGAIFKITEDALVDSVILQDALEVERREPGVNRRFLIIGRRLVAIM